MEKNEQPDFSADEMKLPTQQPGDDTASGAMKKNTGIVVVLLFVILGLLLVGLVYWYNSDTPSAPTPITPERPTAEMNQEPETTTAAAQVESYTVMSTSDELDAVEADLESTNLDVLDAELLQIEAELQASTQ